MDFRLANQGLPDGPFDVATGRGLQPFVPFNDDGRDPHYQVGLAPRIETAIDPLSGTSQTRNPTLKRHSMRLRQRQGTAASAPEGLNRFVVAQDQIIGGHETALEEMRSGRKRSHWIWYVFPQLAGVAMRQSVMGTTYAVRDFGEAVEYLRHPVLGSRLRELADIIAASTTTTAARLMGSKVDAVKLQSCMTLFRRAERALFEERGHVLTYRDDRFGVVLDMYYDGKECQRTVKILGQ